jgi:hypothetical protein
MTAEGYISGKGTFTLMSADGESKQPRPKVRGFPTELHA